jgi:hypothetical protein
MLQFLLELSRRSRENFPLNSSNRGDNRDVSRGEIEKRKLHNFCEFFSPLQQLEKTVEIFLYFS